MLTQPSISHLRFHCCLNPPAGSILFEPRSCTSQLNTTIEVMSDIISDVSLISAYDVYYAYTPKHPSLELTPKSSVHG